MFEIGQHVEVMLYSVHNSAAKFSETGVVVAHHNESYELVQRLNTFIPAAGEFDVEGVLMVVVHHDNISTMAERRARIDAHHQEEYEAGIL